MELNDEVHSESDDGSFELVGFNDYASDEPESPNKDSSNLALSDDGSYDLLCSDVSETLVLTEEDEALITTVSLDNKSLLSKTGLDEDMDVQTETDSDKEEVNMETVSTTKSEEEDEDNHFVFEIGSSSDLEKEAVPQNVRKGRKRHLEAMIYENPNFDPLEYPAHLTLKDDIKVVAKNHIIRYLPAMTLARFRLVSRDFNNWIRGPFFAITQSQYFRKTSGFFSSDRGTIRFTSLDKSAYGVPSPTLRFLPAAVSIRSSGNGLLLCQALDSGTEYYVCNPANKQFVRLPASSYYHGENPKIVLAFEPSSLNFKPSYQVICPFSLPDPDVGPIVYFDIYDSETKSWRISDMVCVDLDESDVQSEGIFVDGIVYWETTGGEMLAFDLKNEIYSAQTLPFGESGALSKVDGELCYVKARYNPSTRTCALDVFGGGVMSLKRTMEFKIGLEKLRNSEFEFKVLANSCDDVVAVVLKTSGGARYLCAYNVVDAKIERPIYIYGPEKMFAYVNSLVPISSAY